MLCVRWNLRYCLSCRDFEKMMAERGADVDRSTIARWVIRYALILKGTDPEGNAQSEHVDET